MRLDSSAALTAHYAQVRAANGGAWPDFEPRIRTLYEALLEPGDTAVDGGACIGLHTFPMARKVAPGGRVVAIEPIPRLARWLRVRALMHANGVIRVERAALGARSGEADFLEASDPGYSGLQRRIYPEGITTRPIRVQTATLDELVSPELRARFIKLDLEGGEFDALRGAERLLEAQRPVIVFEYDRHHTPQFYGFTHQELVAFFERRGYRLFDILGVEFDRPELWDVAEVWYYVAVPLERPTGLFAADP